MECYWWCPDPLLVSVPHKPTSVGLIRCFSCQNSGHFAAECWNRLLGWAQPPAPTQFLNAFQDFGLWHMAISATASIEESNRVLKSNCPTLEKIYVQLMLLDLLFRGVRQGLLFVLSSGFLTQKYLLAFLNISLNNPKYTRFLLSLCSNLMKYFDICFKKSWCGLVIVIKICLWFQQYFGRIKQQYGNPNGVKYDSTKGVFRNDVTLNLHCNHA